MKKLPIKFLSFVVCLSLLLSITCPALAAEATLRESTDSMNVEPALYPDEDTMFEEMMNQLPMDEEYLLSEGLMDSRSLCQKAVTYTRGRAATVYNYFYQSLNMPSAMFYIVATNWESQNYSIEGFAGKDCYKFTKDDIAVYVEIAAFYPPDSFYDESGVCPGNNTVSSTMTRYVNSNQTGYVYSGYWHIYTVDTARYVDLILFGNRVYKSGIDFVAQSTVLETSGFLFYDPVCCPTITISISEKENEESYFDSYYTRGLGYSSRNKNNSTEDFSYLIELGIAAAPIVEGVVTGAALAFSSYASLFGALVIPITTNDDDSKEFHMSLTVPISNPADHEYAYSCSTTSPYLLLEKGNYFQSNITMHNGAIAGVLLDVTISFSDESPM